MDYRWERRERVADDEITIGLPEDTKRAKRAGRDAVIRRLSAHSLAHTEIAEITGLRRQTVNISVNRARALRIDDDDDDDVDLTTIAMRVSALQDVIEHAQEEDQRWRGALVDFTYCTEDELVCERSDNVR